MEDARKCQAAEPGTDDREGSIHPDSFVSAGRHRKL
jgi:hypothetical protein